MGRNWMGPRRTISHPRLCSRLKSSAQQLMRAIEAQQVLACDCLSFANWFCREVEARAQCLLRRDGERLTVDGVNHFARLRITQDHPRLVLNGIGVRLQPLHMLLKTLVLTLQAIYFRLEKLMLMALLLISGNSVGAKDSVVSKQTGYDDGCDGRHAPARAGERRGQDFPHGLFLLAHG